MRSLSARLPAPAGTRWTPEQAEALIGLRGSLTVEPFGPLDGEVVAASVLDDEMGHGLWLTVYSDADRTRDDEAMRTVASAFLTFDQLSPDLLALLRGAA